MPGLIDSQSVNAARLRDRFEGGKDSFSPEAGVVESLADFAPGLAQLYRDERRCQRRMLRYLAGPAGIEQFVVCGAGFPLPPRDDLHDTIFEVHSDARVLYVEADPVAVAACRALRADQGTMVVEEYFADADAIFGRADVQSFLECDLPTAVMHMSTMQSISTMTIARRAMASYVDALPCGSFVALSHLYSPCDNSDLATLASKIESVLNTRTTPTTFRIAADIASLLDGLTILDATAPNPPRDSKSEGPLTAPVFWWQDGPVMGDIPPEALLMRVALAQKEAAADAVAAGRQR
jgi:hypothetical protein